MTQSAIPAAIAGKDHEEIRAAMVAELIPVIPANVDPQTYDPRELGPSGGNVWQAVCWQEKLWFRDEDNTDPHDEITVIVLADGVGYATSDFAFPASVISRSVETPPDAGESPPVAIGDCYLVPAGATDEWAGHEDERALYTARGWKFRPGAAGEVVLVEDEGETGEYIHANKDGEWEDGLPGNFLPASVRPSALLVRSWQFEDQITTAPPASGPAGESYVIGPSATGAWAGHDGKIAWRPYVNAAFVITDPHVGEVGWDKSLGVSIRRKATEWSSASGAIIGMSDIKFAESAGIVNNNGILYIYDNDSPPGLSNALRFDNIVVTYEATRAGDAGADDLNLKFIYDADVTLSSGAAALAGHTLTCALFYDNVALAIAYCLCPGIRKDEFAANSTWQMHLHLELPFAAPDDAEHTYYLAWVTGSAGNTANGIFPSVIERRSMHIEERG